MDLLNQLKANVVAGHLDAAAAYPPGMAGKPGVKELLQQALDEHIPVNTILKDGLIAGMEIVGQKFSAGEYFVPEMLLSAQAMKAGLKMLEPLLIGEKTATNGTVILGTVRGDLHDIGKNLVGMMLEGGGFEVIDLGTNAAPEKFVAVAKEHPHAVIGLSALLTTTMENMRVTINALRTAGLANPVIVGGAAVNQKFADEIQAAGFSRNAAEAVPLVKKILSNVS